MNAIRIRSLSLERLPDYLRFFDTRAFSDNADWSRCYCYFPYCDPSTREWESRSAAANREAVSKLIETGRAQGFLAYAGNEVVGWCNAAPYMHFPVLDSADLIATEDLEKAGAIVCFVVCPEYRGQGIATALLDAACAGLKSQGLRAVFGKPFKGAASTAENYPGPLSMYLAAGFTPLRDDGKGNVIVRKSLE